jgi:hypothetical protein
MSNLSVAEAKIGDDGRPTTLMLKQSESGGADAPRIFQSATRETRGTSSGGNTGLVINKIDERALA